MQIIVIMLLCVFWLMFCLELRSEMRPKLGLLAPPSSLTLQCTSQPAAPRYIGPSLEFWSPKVPLIAFKSNLYSSLLTESVPGMHRASMFAGTSLKQMQPQFVCHAVPSCPECNTSACSNIIHDRWWFQLQTV